MKQKFDYTKFQPSSVWKFFSEIASIPHGSKNLKKINEYLINFAKERQLYYETDSAMNVVIKKEASPDCQNKPVLILQGHIDMVAVKTKECKKDLARDGLDLYVDEDFLYAKDTSLGGDDGIAIAYMLAILDSQTISHPRLECIFTANEEIGMLGASALDTSNIKGKTLLNIDSEDEGIFTVGCAGGLTAIATLQGKTEYINEDSIVCKLTLSGLKGGHSGVEIYPQKMNSNITIGRILYELSKKYNFNIIQISGGEKDNAIANFSTALISITAPGENNNQNVIQLDISQTNSKQKGKNDIEEIESHIKNIFRDIYSQYKISDPEAKLEINFQKIEELDETNKFVISSNASKKILQALLLFPNGIQTMEEGMEHMVHSSLNLGILETKKELDKGMTNIKFSFSIRSSSEAQKMNLYDKISQTMELLGGNARFEGNYPGWEFNKDSKILEKALSSYKKLYKEDAKYESIHAGLECGIFADKIENLDAISFGPQMYDIHTYMEKLSISSSKRTWELLLDIIK